ncbi:MAG: OsmC family peroxiredoxin [Chitinophagaceae bacterium]|nr:MAG: OsmC family peroxiredoxin [Chitinophagaceae bacterium]
MNKTHQYQVSVKWTGDRGQGTADYRSYSREHEVSVDGKLTIPASSDTAFRGDADRYNPEELFISSISTCHMLWYLHLCSDAGVVVVGYTDDARGVMEEGAEGGRFVSVTLYPKVLVTHESMTEKALELHERASRLCFIANSLNFKVGHKPRCDVR